MFFSRNHFLGGFTFHWKELFFRWGGGFIFNWGAPPRGHRFWWGGEGFKKNHSHPPPMTLVYIPVHPTFECNVQCKVFCLSPNNHKRVWQHTIRYVILLYYKVSEANTMQINFSFWTLFMKKSQKFLTLVLLKRKNQLK